MLNQKREKPNRRVSVLILGVTLGVLSTFAADALANELWVPPPHSKIIVYWVGSDPTTIILE